MDHDATQQTAFRLPTALLARLDQYGARLRAEHPGMTVTRADVVRMLLTKALDEADSRGTPARSGLRKRA